MNLTKNNKIVFKPFVKIPLDEVEVEDDMRKTGKYNEKFIKSVVKGLARSSHYTNKSS